MVVPSRQLSDPLTTHRTATFLLPPEVQQFPSPFEVACHSHAEALLKVDFPSRVKRIRPPFDFRMPFDGHPGSREQFDTVGPPGWILPVPTEHPVTVADDLKILVLDPPAWLVRVSAFRPLPQSAEKRVIH